MQTIASIKKLYTFRAFQIVYQIIHYTFIPYYNKNFT